MNSLLEKILKRNNKKQGKNITVAMMVMFLLNSFGSYSQEKNINSNTYENKEMLNSQVLIETLDVDKITNTGTMGGTGSVTQDNDNVGNGLAKSFTDKWTLTIKDLLNGKDGRIIGKTGTVDKTGVNAGNGIGFYSTNGSLNIYRLTNNGNITGEVGAVTGNNNNLGNGIGLYGKQISGIGSMVNNGMLSGKGTTVAGENQNVGNGLGLFTIGTQSSNVNPESRITKLVNTGTISGYVEEVTGTSNISAGNGVSVFASGQSEIGDISNSGTITGHVKNSTEVLTSSQYQSVVAGNGIAIYSLGHAPSAGNINNAGIIMGTNSAIAVINPAGNSVSTGTINNYGIMVGKTPILLTGLKDSDETTKVQENNKGLKITLGEDGDISSVEKGEGGSVVYNNSSYTVKNAEVSDDGKSTTSIKSSDLGLEENRDMILNGVDKTLTVDSSITMSDSIINAHSTAIEIQGSNKFTGNNVTINGGGLDGKTAVIVGDDGNNLVELNGNSIINGNIDLGAGIDKLVFGKEKEDISPIMTFATSSTTPSTILINHDITGADEIDVNQRVIVSENSKFTGVKDVKISDEGTLYLGLNSEGDKLTHALTGNDVAITGTNKTGNIADIMLLTQGIGKGGKVDLEGINLEGTSLGVNSLLYSIDEVTNKEIKINIAGSLEDALTGEKIVVTNTLPSDKENEDGVTTPGGSEDEQPSVVPNPPESSSGVEDGDSQLQPEPPQTGTGSEETDNSQNGGGDTSTGSGSDSQDEGNQGNGTGTTEGQEGGTGDNGGHQDDSSQVGSGDTSAGDSSNNGNGTGSGTEGDNTNGGTEESKPEQGNGGADTGDDGDLQGDDPSVETPEEGNGSIPATPIVPADPVKPETPEDSNNENNTENTLETILNKYAKGISYDKLNSSFMSAMDADPETLAKVIGATLKTDIQQEYLVKYLAELLVSPYSLSSELSRRSATGFAQSVIDNELKPEAQKWTVYGGFTHVDGGMENSFYGLDNKVYSTNAYGQDVDSKLTGMYALGEYGISDTLTAGIIFGGNKGESKLNNGSKVKGDAIYLGAFAKKHYGNLKLTTGLGYQYGDYSADRYSLGADMTRHYSSDYNDNTFNIYGDVRYSYELGDNLYLEPNLSLIYTHISQDGAKENGALSLDVDSKDFDSTQLNIGLDAKKVIVTEKAKHTVKAGVFYERLLDGNDKTEIKSKFNGSSKEFGLLVAEKNEDRVGLRAKYQIDLENGVSFDVKTSYTFEKDQHNGNRKNKTDGEWIVGAGIGYRF